MVKWEWAKLSRKYEYWIRAVNKLHNAIGRGGGSVKLGHNAKGIEGLQRG